MPDWFSTTTYALIVVAVAPLVWLLVYAIADRLGVRWADRMLTTLAWLFAVQSATGGLVNLLGGFAIAALGLWALGRAFASWLAVSAFVLIPFGLWRSWLGFTVLRAQIGR